jgi:predicted ATP-grasp superfamily ATP-dependent carboligase
LEFKHDPRDGKFKLIEVNLRCGNRVGLAIDCGVDIPHIAYLDILGKPPLPVHSYDVGVAWIDLMADLAGLWHYHAMENLTLWDWARSAWAAKSHAYFAIDDHFHGVHISGEQRKSPRRCCIGAHEARCHGSRNRAA